MENTYADVILSINHSQLDKIFQYRIPDHLIEKMRVGIRVKVPFGHSNRLQTGYIIGIGSTLLWDEDKTKDIEEVLDQEQAIDEELIHLAKWMKERYASTLSACLQTIVPKQVINKESYVQLNDNLDTEMVLQELRRKKYVRQLSVIEYLACHGASTPKEIRQNCQVTNSVIERLIKQNILIKFNSKIRRKIKKEAITQEQPLQMSTEQTEAYDKIIKNLQQEEKRPILLYGVTGSGKTEVYMQAIEQVISQDKEAILLIPEISLTPQMVEKFERRFGDLVGVTHSRLNATERLDVWKKANKGEIKVVLGPRSALFTPFKRLGIVIIDEEHERTYKSETSPKYHAIETAQHLCKLKNALLILGSATPAVESYYKATMGEYDMVHMSKRVTSQLPQVELVDMRNELQLGNRDILSQSLKEAIEDRLNKKEQIILFLNRRGYSTFVSCRQCGFVLKCPKCDLPYTYHANNGQLICHHCGKNEHMKMNCPICSSKYIKYFGIGTQKVEKYIVENYKEARVLRMDMDTTSTKNAHEMLYKKFKNREADILIGTQMIAKGLDFPYVTLVGILAADMSLYTSDFRSAERTFQLLTQVSGRAGRSRIKGEVVIQTYTPDHYSIQSALKQDYLDFYNQEIIYRKTLDYPPYTNLLEFLIQEGNEKFVIQSAHGFYSLLQHYGESRGFQLMGPAPAVLSKVNDTYRWRISVKHKDYDRLKNFAIYCLNKYRSFNKQINITFDLNPLMGN